MKCLLNFIMKKWKNETLLFVKGIILTKLIYIFELIEKELLS